MIIDTENASKAATVKGYRNYKRHRSSAGGTTTSGTTTSKT